MENFYHSDWAEGANFSNCNTAGNNEFPFLVPGPLPPHVSSVSDSIQFDGFPSWSVPIEGFAEDRAASTSKSHSQAEKRRRDRINAQLAILRKLVPQSDKMDKAALLGSVIEEVKDLKRKATELSKAFMIPTEVDELTVDNLAQDVTSSTNTGENKEKIFFKATICCDDQPEVYAELIRVIKGLRLNTIKADITSVGGRMKSNLVLCNKDCAESVSVSTVKQSLSVVLSRIASSSVAPNCRIRSKRQRLFFTSHYSQ